MLLRRVWAYMHVGLVPCLHPYMALNTYVTNPLFTILHEEKLDSPNSPVLGTKVGRGARKWLSKGKPTPTSVRSLIGAGSFPCVVSMVPCLPPLLESGTERNLDNGRILTRLWYITSQDHCHLSAENGQLVWAPSCLERSVTAHPVSSAVL